MCHRHLYHAIKTNYSVRTQVLLMSVSNFKNDLLLGPLFDLYLKWGGDKVAYLERVPQN